MVSAFACRRCLFGRGRCCLSRGRFFGRRCGKGQGLAALVPWLTGEKPLAEPAQEDPSWKHYPWLCDIVARRGLCASEVEASAVLREEVAEVCARVLEDAGVYKHTEAGLAGMLRFLASVEMTSC